MFTRNLSWNDASTTSLRQSKYPSFDREFVFYSNCPTIFQIVQEVQLRTARTED